MRATILQLRVWQLAREVEIGEVSHSLKLVLKLLMTARAVKRRISRSLLYQ